MYIKISDGDGQGRSPSTCLGQDEVSPQSYYYNHVLTRVFNVTYEERKKNMGRSVHLQTSNTHSHGQEGWKIENVKFGIVRCTHTPNADDCSLPPFPPLPYMMVAFLRKDKLGSYIQLSQASHLRTSTDSVVVMWEVGSFCRPHAELLAPWRPTATDRRLRRPNHRNPILPLGR